MLQLYFRAGSTEQVLNNTFIRPFKQIKKQIQARLNSISALQRLFLLCLPSLRGSLYQNTAEIQDPSSASPHKKQRHKRGIKDTEHANNQMFSYVEEWLLLVTHPRTRQH